MTSHEIWRNLKLVPVILYPSTSRPPSSLLPENSPAHLALSLARIPSKAGRLGYSLHGLRSYYPVVPPTTAPAPACQPPLDPHLEGQAQTSPPPPPPLLVPLISPFFPHMMETSVLAPTQLEPRSPHIVYVFRLNVLHQYSSSGSLWSIAPPPL